MLPPASIILLSIPNDGATTACCNAKIELTAKINALLFLLFDFMMLNLKSFALNTIHFHFYTYINELTCQKIDIFQGKLYKNS